MAAARLSETARVRHRIVYLSKQASWRQQIRRRLCCVCWCRPQMEPYTCTCVLENLSARHICQPEWNESCVSKQNTTGNKCLSLSCLELNATKLCQSQDNNVCNSSVTSILLKNELEYKSISFRDWTLLFCDLFHYRTTDIIQRKPLTDGRDTRQLLTVSSQESGSVVAQDLLTTTVNVPRLSTQHTELWSRWMQKTRLACVLRLQVTQPWYQLSTCLDTVTSLRVFCWPRPSLYHTGASHVG